MVGGPKAWERHWEVRVRRSDVRMLGRARGSNRPSCVCFGLQIIDRVGIPEFTPDPKLLSKCRAALAGHRAGLRGQRRV